MPPTIPPTTILLLEEVPHLGQFFRTSSAYLCPHFLQLRHV
jgi:hypothetical protein